MTRLQWAARPYEAGISHGVLYPPGDPAVPWNGIVALTDQTSGSDPYTIYIDGKPVKQNRNREEFLAKLEALTYPEELELLTGLNNSITNQWLRPFDLSYKTGSHIHLLYNVMAVSADIPRESWSESIGPTTFAWDLYTMSELVPGYSPSSHLIVDTDKALSATINGLENLLYGTADSFGYMPSIDEVLGLFENSAVLRIDYNGDGTWTATGPDEAIVMVSPTQFQITWPSAVFISEDTYRISSL